MSSQVPSVNPGLVITPVGQQSGLNQFTTVNVSGAAATVVQVFTGPGQLFGGSFGSVAAVARYLKCFDVAANTNISGASAVQSFIIPGNAAGAGSNLGPHGLAHNAGLQFVNGLAIALTANIALTDQSGAGGQDTNINLWWR